jgi:site-specific DNA-cytosine methylase
MTAEAMRQLKFPFPINHFDVEKEPIARAIATLHHHTNTTSLPNDINLITRQHLADLSSKYGKVGLVVISTPCQDLSTANTHGTGLDGEESSLFLVALDVLDMVKELNPDVLYLIENVQFEQNHPAAYLKLNTRIGHKPIEDDARNCSAANRKRYFWTNIPQPPPLLHPLPSTPTSTLTAPTA